MTYATPNATPLERVITLKMSVMQAHHILSILEGNGTSKERTTSSANAHLKMTIDEIKSELLKG